MQEIFEENKFIKRPCELFLTIGKPIQEPRSTEDYLSWVAEIFRADGYIGQLEEGKEDGHRHLQCIFHMQKGFHDGGRRAITRFREMKPGVQIHSELIRNPQAAMKYVQKQDTRIEGPF